MQSTSGKIDNAIEKLVNVAEHYGFEPIKSDPLTYGPRFLTGLANAHEPDNSDMDQTTHFLNDRLTNPVASPNMFYEITISRIKPYKTQANLDLFMAGVDGGLAEATLMHVARSALDEIGVKKYTVVINSMGDRDSASRFTRAFSSYSRRNINKFGICCRSSAKNNIYSLIECRSDECVNAKFNAPKPIDFLSEGGRSNFKNVLEHLESLNIPYIIDEWHVDQDHKYLTIFFSIKPEESIAISIRGGRYGYSHKVTGFKRNVTLSGITFSIKAGFSDIKKFNVHNIRPKKPRVFIVQMGCEARKLGLLALERLRLARIPVIQNINFLKLTDQINFAENSAIPYIIIIGHKEAMEGSAILRNTESRSQKTVPIDALPALIRHAKMFGL